MKIFRLIAIFLIGALIGCKEEESLTAQQEAAKLLSGTWSGTEVLSAPVAGATGSLANLVLTFNISDQLQPLTLSVSGAADFFPTGSTWAWVDQTSTSAIVLDGNLPVTTLSLEELTSTSLKIGFSLAKPIGGRTDGVGEYVLRLTKQ